VTMSVLQPSPGRRLLVFKVSVARTPFTQSGFTVSYLVFKVYHLGTLLLNDMFSPRYMASFDSGEPPIDALEHFDGVHQFGFHFLSTGEGSPHRSSEMANMSALRMYQST
jgi:hypothetical protein